MKTLVLLDDKPNVDNDVDVFANMNRLIKQFGKRFMVLFKAKEVPLLIQKRILNDNEYVFSIVIDAPKTYHMKYHTLHITIGEDDDNQTAYIINVNKNEQFGLSGSYIVKFAIAILQYVSIKRIVLRDLAKTVLEGKRQCTVNLSSYLLLKKATTFYGKFGFQPELSDYTDTSYESNDAMHKRLCYIVNKLHNIKVLQVLNYLKRILILRDRNKISNIIETQKDYKVGVIENLEPMLPLDEQLVVMTLSAEKIVKVLLKYENNTFVEVFEQCSCTEYISIYNFFTRFPSIIMYDNNKTLKNTCKELFQEMTYILNNVNYVLNLNSDTFTSSTC
jgi:hypothetical protein